MTIIIPNYYC